MSSNFLMASSSSASSSSRAVRQVKYDCFLSFSGKDTRDGFISHLHDAFCQKGIETFIDNELKRGKEIRPALFQAIEESEIAVVIFSKHYACSTWCLDELAKIVESNETHGLVILPIFYRIDPSDIRKQTGHFQKAFAKHEKSFKEDLDKVQRWRDALTKAANISGRDSRVAGPESKLVNDIANDVLKNLKQTSTSGLKGLVGIHSRIQEIKALLSIGSLDVRILGIWGMGGIGKTTIAEAVFNGISCQFEGCCFLSNVREQLEKHGIKHLLEELLSKILGERDLKVDTINVGPSFVKRLRRKKVLIVLDDVNNLLQLEPLAGDCSWFGPGSRIIITSRDKHVLQKYVNDIYEVRGLQSDKALQLFSLNAFKLDHPSKDHEAQSNLVVKYAKGNPLALKVLGSFLFGKNRKEWESALNKLEKSPNMDIQDVLKISFDGLDEEEKDIFLHIACFFKGEDKQCIIDVLNRCGLSTDIGVRVLIDKSLITVSIENDLEMHDLLQEMGKQIVRQEAKDPGQRSRLWDVDDIYGVFTKDTGTESIQSILLDMSKITEVHLNSNAFVKMPNLKLLKFYMPDNNKGFEEDCKVRLSGDPVSLPNELRYLYWHGYPFKFLPANFNPVNLVGLKLPYSNVKRPWKVSKYLENLKEIDLSHSRRRIKIPHRSQVPNLMRINLDGCTYLYKVPSSVRYLSNLSFVSMRDCENITSLPSNIDLKSLETLDLSGCSNLEIFPEVSSNIRWLYLEGTSIKEVPSSIECLSRLEGLHMENCTKLEILPSSICKLKSLEVFRLSGCSNLENFPEILETMDNLDELFLSGTSIRELPLSIDNLKGLHQLGMDNCTNVTRLPDSFGNLEALRDFHLSGCSKLEQLPRKKDLEVVQCKDQDFVGFPLLTWSGFSHLVSLGLRDCSLWTLPADINCLCSLVELDLSKNKFERIPESIKQLSELEILYINYCQRLKSLPELPPCLRVIEAVDCISLETISGLGQLFELEYHHARPDEEFKLTNCFRLSQKEWSDTTANALLRIQRFSTGGKDCEEERAPFVIFCYSGSEIPEWFTSKSLEDSIIIQLPQNWLNNKFLGFALCIVVSFQDYEENRFYVDYECHFQNNHGDSSDLYLNSKKLGIWGEFDNTYDGEYVLLWYDTDLYDAIAEKWDSFDEHCYSKASFVFYPKFDKESFKVKKCGIILLYAQGQEYNQLGIPVTAAMTKSKRKRKPKSKSQRRSPKKLKQMKDTPESSSMDP